MQRRKRNHINYELCHAIEQGNLNEVKILLKEGADIIVGAAEYVSKPIHVAAEFGHKAIIQLLLQNGVSVEQTDIFGLTPLHYASKGGKLDVIEYLLQIGANADIGSTYDGRKPIHVAAKYGHRNIIEIFTKLGINIEETNKRGWTCLHYAALRDQSETIEYLLEIGAKADVQDCIGRTPLHYAAEGTHSDVIKKMLETIPNLNLQDNEGDTPLHLASYNDNTELMKYLLEAGSSSDLKNSDGYTPSFYIIQNCCRTNTPLSKELLEKVNNYRDLDDLEKQTAAHLAIEEYCDVELLQVILKKQKDLNTEDVNGDTPLNYLTEEWSLSHGEKCAEFIKLLIDNGAFFKAKDCKRIIANNSLKYNLLADVKLCSKSLVNEFHNGNLPILYTLPILIPSLENMTLSEYQVQEIEQAVGATVEVGGFCDVSAIVLKPLKMLSVESFICH